MVVSDRVPHGCWAAYIQYSWYVLHCIATIQLPTCTHQSHCSYRSSSSLRSKSAWLNTSIVAMCGQITPTFNVQCLLGSYKQACIQKHRPVEPSAQRDTRVRIFLLSQLCVLRPDLSLLLSCAGWCWKQVSVWLRRDWRVNNLISYEHGETRLWANLDVCALDLKTGVVKFWSPREIGPPGDKSHGRLVPPSWGW